MRHRHSWFIACAALLALGHAAYAESNKAWWQENPATPPITPLAGAPTLAQALLKAPPSATDMAIAVGADSVQGSASTPALDPDARAPIVAAAYGYLARDFHGVTAIAPPTMTVFNANPGKPNPFDGMPAPDAFRMLLGSLDDSQWKLLTGKIGLGFSDLTSDDQKNLFTAIFPDNALTLFPRTNGPGGISDPASAPKLTAEDLRKAKLRIGQRVRMGLPIEGRNNSSLIADAPSGGEQSYGAMGHFGNDDGRDTLYGVKLRAIVPNTLKDSDLDYDDRPLTTQIDCSGVKTVGDLITRIGVATRTELYADQRYEKQSVLILGPSSARARDLLQALALCVRGTYRRVGPAYVLTNSLIGAGVSQTVLIHFAQEADIERKRAIDEAGDKAYQAQQGVANNQFDENLKMTDEQKAQALKEGGDYPGNDLTFSAPLNKLTPSQQAMATDWIQKWNAKIPQSADPSQMRLTSSLPISLWINTTVVMSTPAIPGQIVMDDYFGRNGLLRPSDKLRNAMEEKRSKEMAKANPAADAKPDAPKPAPPQWDLSTIFAHLPQRCVIAKPQTSEDLDKIIRQMRTIGLNQLWLDAFSHGKSHLDDKPDLITEAVKKTKGSGITVVPVLDLLNWDIDTPATMQDRTMMGENSAQAAAWRNRFTNIFYQGMTPEEAEKAAPPAHLAADLANPSIRDTLTAALARLAAIPGIGAPALSGQFPSGYSVDPNYINATDGYTLGYTEAMRLGFLRANHLDPIDLDNELYSDTPVAQWRVPEFQDWQTQALASSKWNEYRSHVAVGFMKSLLGAYQTGAGQSAGLMIRAQGMQWAQGWYGFWRDPQKIMPHIIEEEWTGVQSNAGPGAHAQAATTIAILQPWALQTQNGLSEAIKNIGPGWDGFVIDLSDPNASPNILSSLADSFAPAKKTAPKPAKAPSPPAGG